MKNRDRDPNLYENDLEPKKDLYLDAYKTTNVNILLNRVRLDKKRSFKKRITISFFLVTIITALTVYFII